MKALHRKHARTTLVMIATLLVAACASNYYEGATGAGVATSSEPQGTPLPSGNAPASAHENDSEFGMIEEILVTGARAPARRMQRDEAELEARRARSHATAAQRYELKRQRWLEKQQGPDQALSRVNAGEEVWVIARAGEVAVDDDRPGTGSMLTLVSDGPGLPPVRVPLPLQHTAVTASVEGYIGSVNVRQSFSNPYSTKIEAVYVFPLPEKAAVSEFVMIIGERRIRGILREKEEAKAIYDEARRQGYQASLLLQQRPNIFQQKVANIEPGKAIDIDIRYFHTLPYVDGWYSFVFPTVVGPRFNPPGSKDPIKAAPRGATPGSDGTTVSYLDPSERSGHDISINLRIDAGVEIEGLRATHEIVSEQVSPNIADVSLAAEAVIPNRDFVLDFKVAGDTLRSNLMTWEDEESGKGYFSMMLYPPATLRNLERRPMEMVFVLDCSGSMNGKPMQQAKAAILAALDNLVPGDTFQVIRFSSDASQLGDAPLPATRENIAAARDYVRRLSGTGGTMMIEGVRAALKFPHDPERLRFVTFLTDGYIGNEAEVIGAVHELVGEARVFSFGVGNSVNRFLMERMAKEGRGAVAYLGLDDSGKEVMDAFFERISHPAMTDIAIDWGRMQVSSVYPSSLPDLFVGRPVFVTGTYQGTVDSVSVSGLAGGETQQFVISSRQDGDANLAKLWARLKIADYADKQTWQSDPYGEFAATIRDTALEYQLMSAYTAFVAVDASRQTDGSYGVTVQQAVPVPDGVRYDTTVN